jgi:hypothetical protein
LDEYSATVIANVVLVNEFELRLLPSPMIRRRRQMADEHATKMNQHNDVALPGRSRHRNDNHKLPY